VQGLARVRGKLARAALIFGPLRTHAGTAALDVGGLRSGFWGGHLLGGERDAGFTRGILVRVSGGSQAVIAGHQPAALPRAVFVETPPTAVRNLPGTTAVGASPQVATPEISAALETPRRRGNGKDFDSAWGVSTGISACDPIFRVPGRRPAVPRGAPPSCPPPIPNPPPPRGEGRGRRRKLLPNRS